jgi:hypothetical protein
MRAGFGSPPAKEIIDGLSVIFRISLINDFGVFPIRLAKYLRRAWGCRISSSVCGLIIHQITPELFKKERNKVFP